jgi:hypothetical protein
MVSPTIPYSHYLNRRDPSSRLVTEDEYYNTGRDPERANKNRPEHIIERMMKSLDSAGFHVRVRWTMTYEGSKAIKRLDQIFFVSDAQIRKARRFCSDFMLQIDATFNKNKLQMPLVNIVGVDNHGKTFTVALSFVRAEASIDFKFIFDWLDQLVFFAGGCRPKVLISDQAAGLHGAVLVHPTWKTVFHQLCQWHMFGNIKSFVQKHRRIQTLEDLDELVKAVWAVIQCWNVEDLPAKRQDMIHLFDAEETEYYRANWMMNEKEKRVITCYVRLCPNLGLHSSARAEGQHRVIARFLNNQMNLDDAAKALIRNVAIQDSHDNIRDAQSQVKRHQPAAIGMDGLRHLETIITATAISLMKKEMHEAQVRARTGPPAHDPNSCPRSCQNPLRYGLPCRHLMHAHVAANRLLPWSLIHPRWFINPEDAPRLRNWHESPADPDTSDSPAAPHYLQGAGEILLASHALEAEAFRERLSTDQAEQFAIRFGSVTKELQKEFTPGPDAQAATVAFPPPPPLSKRAEELRRKKHKKASIRLPTAHEQAEIDARKNKRAAEALSQAAASSLPSTAPSSVPPEVLDLTGAERETVRPAAKKRTRNGKVPVFDLTGAEPETPAAKKRQRKYKVPAFDLTGEDGVQAETQEMDHWEEAYYRDIEESVQPRAGESQQFPIDLCSLDTQHREWAEKYTGRLPAQEEEAPDTQLSTQLSWHYELDTQPM